MIQVGTWSGLVLLDLWHLLHLGHPLHHPPHHRPLGAHPPQAPQLCQPRHQDAVQDHKPQGKQTININGNTSKSKSNDNTSKSNNNNQASIDKLVLRSWLCLNVRVNLATLVVLLNIFVFPVCKYKYIFNNIWKFVVYFCLQCLGDFFVLGILTGDHNFSPFWVIFCLGKNYSPGTKNIFCKLWFLFCQAKNTHRRFFFPSSSTFGWTFLPEKNYSQETKKVFFATFWWFFVPDKNYFQESKL